jgi:lysozyme family protein
MVFDFGVNSGIFRAAKLLQLKVSAASMDGHIGPKTLAKLNEFIAKNSLTKLVDDYCNSRMEFLRGLSTFSTFGKGWTNRVRDVQSLSKGTFSV